MKKRKTWREYATKRRNPPYSPRKFGPVHFRDREEYQYFRTKCVDTPTAHGLDSSAMALTVEARRRDDEARSAYEAAETRPGKPIRLRMQPQLYFHLANKQYRTGAFLSWRSVYWNVLCPTVADALKVRDALGSLFKALAVLDADEVIAILDSEVQKRIESATSAPATVRVQAGATVD